LKIYGGVKPKGLQKLLNKEADRQPYLLSSLNTYLKRKVKPVQRCWYR